MSYYSYSWGAFYTRFPLGQDTDVEQTLPSFNLLIDVAPNTSFETVIWEGDDIIIREILLVSRASGFRTIDNLCIPNSFKYDSWFRNISIHRRTICAGDDIIYTFYFEGSHDFYMSGDVVEGYQPLNKIIRRMLPEVDWRGTVWGVKHRYTTGIPMPINLDEARQCLSTFAHAYMRGHDDLFIPASPPQHGSFAPGIYMPPSTCLIGPADSERSMSSSVLRVYSTPELMANVISELDTMSLLMLRCTSGRLRHLVNRTFYGWLCKLLSLFIPYGHLEEFKNTLNRTESILAGVFVVAVMIWERSWDPSQLDLLIPSTARAAWNEFFTEAGFVREHVVDRVDSYGNERSVTATWRSRGDYESIRLVESADGMALSSMFTARTTMTLNFMTMSTIYSLYPRQTFRRQALISQDRHSSTAGLLTSSVKQLGFTAICDSAGPGLDCGMGCLSRVRTLQGFRGVAVIDILEKDHDITQRPQKAIDEALIACPWVEGFEKSQGSSKERPDPQP
ncbi:hypothetical protein ARMGADRAFT_1022657 [Armillaria gallica]|uniref:F-box domain-containing protein n=1 Tax=Armillaria gallica TaxID=47427 RepID=A0A2H3EDS4_ARMGA|nr:hypothetical protein ARMGADRAFT_1022657 [Armillaria gallica]